METVDRAAIAALTHKAAAEGSRDPAVGAVKPLNSILSCLPRLAPESGSGSVPSVPLVKPAPDPAQASRRLLAMSGLEPHERRLELVALREYGHQRQAMHRLREFLAAAQAGKAEHRLPEWWLVLSSAETGTGKSYLAMALVADLCRAGVSATFLPEVEMMAQLREAQRPGSSFGIVQLRERWIKAPVLVLDDLTADKASEFSARELYQLVEARRRKRRPLIITTNASEDQMQAHFDAAAEAQGRRIVSRIVGMCRGGATWVHMDGPDLRAEGEVGGGDGC